ncbi:MAG: RNA pyrophosphohydrolase [Gammaproteobacteria bacterium]|nr:RNA pyrophosphohydrolase [Gammaproteobacteria bacterium]
MSDQQIDAQGLRPNVGIILLNKYQEVFWAKRCGQLDAWQFPQGGIDTGETPEQALYRELYEEVGLEKDDVKCLGETKSWFIYRLPKKYLRRDSLPLCVGQKQKWFLLELRAPVEKINFNLGKKAEFEGWRWVDYWHPVDHVIHFKKNVYRKALQEFSPIVFGH